MKAIFKIFNALFFNPLLLLMKLRALLPYAKNILTYQSLSSDSNFKLKFRNLYFHTYDKYLNSGVAQGHYFHQDLWAAKEVYKSQVKSHVDIGSRVDGFVAHILSFCEVQFVDIRKLESRTSGLTFIEGSITKLPFENDSIQSLSCLHVMEHIGLGTVSYTHLTLPTKA